MFEILLISKPLMLVGAMFVHLNSFVLIVEYCASPIHSLLHFPKYHMKILLVEVGRENIFKLTIGNESVHQDSNDNGVRIVNFAKSKNWFLSSKCSSTQTFISTSGPLLMGRLTVRLITY
jgi:hypothetical protein